MNKIKPRKLISLNISFALIAFLIWMVTSGVDVITVYGATQPIPFTYDRGPFNITDLSIKEGDYSNDDLIGFIQNVDPYLRTIKDLSLKIEMYDRNKHLIDVAESGSGYSSLIPETFEPQTKSAFKIPIGQAKTVIWITYAQRFQQKIGELQIHTQIKIYRLQEIIHQIVHTWE